MVGVAVAQTEFVNILNGGQRKKRGVDYLPNTECHSGVNRAELAVSKLGQL